MLNDSIWFANFAWVGSGNPANCIKLDICWKEAGGNTFGFLDAHLENGLYVTIGLRQTESGDRKASVSVFKNNASFSIFDQVRSNPSEGFFCSPGGEGDKYCKGDYQFGFGEHHQLIIKATEDKITGNICRLSDQRVIEIATFLTGSGSLIGAGSSNGFALEHFGMADPCKHKSQIMIRAPLRIDTKGLQSTARGGVVYYQECQNSALSKGSNRDIILSHGGDTKRSVIDNGNFVLWD